MSELNGYESDIPGLYVINLDVKKDNRGWFKENYQEEKLRALGMPILKIVQNNISLSENVGVTRGLHAEPWNKYISMAFGRVFGAWVDLRKGDSFGKTFTVEINPETAIFVPRGVANGYQTLTENSAYTYLVDAHWSPESKYTFVNQFDPELGINWPIDQNKAITSEKDKNHPCLKDVIPMEFPDGK